MSNTATIAGTLGTGNTTVTGFVNVSTYGTFAGAVNAASLNISGLTAAGNTTVTGFVNVSTYGTFGGTVNAAALNISGLTASGNTTVTGFVNVSSYGTFAGTVNAAALNVSGVTSTGNTTVTGFVNVSTNGTVGGNLNVTGNTVLNSIVTLQVVSNTNLGVTTASPVEVFTFPWTSTGAKITAKIGSLGGANTQVQELIIAQNTTDLVLTVYGTVAAPAGANLGVFSALINTAASAVSVRFQQTGANSSVKLLTQLIT